MTDLDRFDRHLGAVGVPLRQLGLNELAFRRTDALRAIDLLTNTSVPILGGDVYVERDGRIQLAYANWHSDRLATESTADFAVRSRKASWQYVANYPRRDGEIPLFVFVVARSGSTAG